MGNVLASGIAFVLSITASVYALKAWRKAEGVPKKWLGWGGVVLLIPALLLLIAIVLILLFGIGLVLIRAVLGLSILTLIIGASFIVYGAIALNTKENKTDSEKEAVKDAIIAALISGIGAFVLIVGFIVKLSSTGKKTGVISLPGVKK